MDSEASLSATTKSSDLGDRTPDTTSHGTSESELSSSRSISSHLEIGNSFDRSLYDLVVQLKLDRHEGPADEHDDGNTFLNVHYYSDSAASTPTFIDCQLENVHFIQCNFRDTEFCNLKLINVAFLYIDLDNVTMSDLSLEGHLWKTTGVRNAYLLGPATSCASDPTKTVLDPSSPISTRHPGENTVVETLRLSTPSSRAARALRKFEDSFQLSLQVSSHPQNQLVFRLLDHKHIMSQIVEYSISGNDYLFQRYVMKIHFSNTPRLTVGEHRSRRSRIVTLREQAPPFFSQNHAIHVHCPESVRAICILDLILLGTRIARPSAPDDRMHISIDWLQCRVTELHNLRPTSNTVLMLYYQFEGGIGSTKTDDEAWHHLMNCIRHDHSYIPKVHLRIDKRFW